METTNYQQQVPFDLETKGKIQESLQEIYNKQQQQQATNANSGKEESLSNSCMTWSRNVLASQGDSIKNKYRKKTL